MQQWVQKISPVLLRSELLENPDQPCRIIVEMASPQPFRVTSYVEASQGKVHRSLKYTPFLAVELPYAKMQLLVMSPHVRKVWQDTKVRALLDIAVPATGGTKAHGLGMTGNGTTVAVIDTGIYPHPDLIVPQNRIIAWKDLVNGRPLPYDDNGHGTHVAGIIAGNGLSSRGKYVGMAPEAKLVAIKALDHEGSGNTSDVIAALEWCIENQKTYNIKAVNLSLGSAAQDSCREDPLCRAIAIAWNKGIVVCTAAGNDGPAPRTINTPGISPLAITVGNLDDKGTKELGDDVISDTSSRGPTIDNVMKPDLLAPGTEIMSLGIRRAYRSLSGTSMATGLVTGAVAQIYQKWPSLKPDQVKQLLKANAKNLGFQANYGGAGVLNLETLFEERKDDGEKKGSLFNNLFGKNSIFKQVFSSNKTKDRKAVPSNEGADQASKFNSLALLMLIPLMLL